MGGQGHACADRRQGVRRPARLEEMGLPAVRPAGLVLQPEFDTAILVTRYLEGSWQYRRLFMRLPPDQPKHRARLLDAMAGLLVELHRHGVFWGDCSLANTLFSRDGQLLQAWLVDAETSEVHPTLSRGQRSTTSTSWWRTSRGHRRSGRAARQARSVARHVDRRSRTGSDPGTTRCGSCCTPNPSSASPTATASRAPFGNSTSSGSPSTRYRCSPSATTRANSNFMSPLGIGATTPNVCRSSPVGRRRGASAHPARRHAWRIRRSCAGRRATTSTSPLLPGCG